MYARILYWSHSLTNIDRGHIWCYEKGELIQINLVISLLSSIVFGLTGKYSSPSLHKCDKVACLSPKLTFHIYVLALIGVEYDARIYPARMIVIGLSH